MYAWSESSSSKLATCAAPIQVWANAMAEVFNCTVIDGYRRPEVQLQKFNQGLSKVKFGKHNVHPSRAIDIAPWPVIWPGLPDNPTADQIVKYMKEMGRWYIFIGYGKALAEQLDVPLRNGGDWDGDNDPGDQDFDDLVHWELIDE